MSGNETPVAGDTYIQILKSTVLIGSSSVVTMGFAIIRNKAMAMLLGPEGVGLIGIYSSIADIAQTVAGLGIQSSGVRQIAEAAGTGDAGKIARTASVLQRVSIALGIAGTIMLAALAFPVAWFTFGDHQHVVGVALLSLAIFFRLASAGQTALIQGLREISTLARINVLAAFFTTVTTIPLVYLFGSEGIVPSLVAAAAATLLTSWWYSRQMLQNAPNLSIPQFRQELAGLVKLGFVFMISGLLTLGSAYVVRIIVLQQGGVAAAGLYQAAWALSGFSICRNAVQYDYPVLEAIRSALPLVDEFVVNVGQSADGTLDLIRSIGSDKLRIVESVWDDSMKKDGLLLSYETNKALAQCSGDWALYLQADEVLHEAHYDGLLKTLHDQLPVPEILGFTFRYLHFYGDYWSCNPWFHHRAVRVVRNNGKVESCGDAVGFCLKADQGYLQTAHKNSVRPSGATIFHYGWVKSPKVLQAKFRYMTARYHGDDPGPEQARLLAREAYEFEDYDIMRTFSGTHPAVMAERVSRFPMLKPQRNRWLNPAFYRAVMKRGFRG